MKQRFQGIIIGSLVTIILFGGIFTVVGANVVTRNIEVLFGNYKLYVAGVELVARDTEGKLIEPFALNGNMFVPAEEIARAYNATVHWVQETGSLYLGAAGSVVTTPATTRTEPIANTITTITANPVSDFEYEIHGNEIFITRYLGGSSVVVIPSEINGLPVTQIGRNLDNIQFALALATGAARFPFDNRGDITSITIPSSVTNIGAGAFHGLSGLNNITIPNNVTCIGTMAFTDTTSLTYLLIPNSVTSIGSSAFSGSGISRISLPANITSIESETFSNCVNLTSITIPASVTSIGNGAFRNSGLQIIYFEGSAPRIDINVFRRGNDSLLNATIYYRRGTNGWSNPWHGLPTAPF